LDTSNNNYLDELVYDDNITKIIKQ